MYDIHAIHIIKPIYIQIILQDLKTIICLYYIVIQLFILFMLK